MSAGLTNKRCNERCRALRMAVPGETRVRRHCGDSPAASPYPLGSGRASRKWYYGLAVLVPLLSTPCCRDAVTVRYRTILHRTEADFHRPIPTLSQAHERQDLILLDEPGYVPFSKAGTELLFDVVGRVYEQTSLIVTTNLPFEQWPEVLGSERLTGAPLDWLIHRVHILEANGPSYRLSDAKRRLKNPPPVPEKP